MTKQRIVVRPIAEHEPEEPRPDILAKPGIREPAAVEEHHKPCRMPILTFDSEQIYRAASAASRLRLTSHRQLPNMNSPRVNRMTVDVSGTGATAPLSGSPS